MKTEIIEQAAPTALERLDNGTGLHRNFARQLRRIIHKDHRQGVLDGYLIDCAVCTAIPPEPLLARHWAQIEAAARSADKIPLLAYSGRSSDWRVVIPINAINPQYVGVGLDTTVEMSLPTFCGFVEWSE